MNMELNGMDSCKKVREFIDPYVSDELPASVRAEIEDHLAICAECSDIVNDRRRIRTAIRNAVANQPVPEGLRSDVMARLRNAESTPVKRSIFYLLTGPARNYSIAASLLLLLIGWSIYRVTNQNDLPIPPEPTIVDLGGAQLRTEKILNLGLGDHVICALRAHHADDHESFATMVQKLGPEYKGLIPIVQAKLPDFELVVSHHCAFDGRKFIHMILRKGETVVSLAFTLKGNESLDRDSVVSVAAVAGLRLYRERLKEPNDFEVTGFETQKYLAFVVSDQSMEENLRIARLIGPDVQTLLDQVPG